MDCRTSSLFVVENSKKTVTNNKKSLLHVKWHVFRFHIYHILGNLTLKVYDDTKS